MKFLVLIAAMSASPGEAEVITYPQCIDMLQAMLRNDQALYDAMTDQLDAMPNTDPGGPLEAARVANIRARSDVDAAIKPYVKALADGCEAIRAKLQ